MTARGLATVEPLFMDLPLHKALHCCFDPRESPYVFSKFSLLNTDTH